MEIPYMSNHGWSALVDSFLGLSGSMITVVASSPASTFSQLLSALQLPNVMTITGKGNTLLIYKIIIAPGKVLGLEAKQG